MLKRLIRARLSQTQQKTEITRSAVDCYSTEIFRFHSIFGFSTWIIKHSSHHQLPVDKEQQLGRESASLGKNMEKVIVSELILNWSCNKDFLIFIRQRVGCFKKSRAGATEIDGSALQHIGKIPQVKPHFINWMKVNNLKCIQVHSEQGNFWRKSRQFEFKPHLKHCI